MADVPLLPCPGCGFLIHPEAQYGSYGICPFCNWEDCAFQLANPHDRGGPNGMSLVEHQAIGLRSYPLTVRTAEAWGRTFKRDPHWRPLTPEEIAFYDQAPDAFPAIYEPKGCYWIQSPLSGHAAAG
jgi:hypothetical protein